MGKAFGAPLTSSVREHNNSRGGYMSRKFRKSTKPFIVLTIILLLFCVFSPLSADVSTPVANSTNPRSSLISQAKDIMNILFFLVVGTIAILSYLQARKTIFTPLKTEIFKLQLNLFEEIFAYFDHHKKQHFIDSFDFRKIFKINMNFLFNSYTAFFFKDEIQVDKEKEKQLKAEVPIMNMAFKYADRFEKTDDGIILDLSNLKTYIQNPEDRLSEWLKHEYVMIHFTNNFQTQMDQLDKFISSPLVPSDIKNLIREFQVAAYHNIHAMAEVLTEASKELPEKYKTADDLMKASTSWIWNKYVGKQTSLEDISDRIYTNINNYLNTDNLLK